VPGNEGVDGPLPLAARGMQVRVADAAEQDLDLHVARAGVAALEAEGGEGGGGRVGGVGVGFDYEELPFRSWSRLRMPFLRRMSICGCPTAEFKFERGTLCGVACRGGRDPLAHSR